MSNNNFFLIVLALLFYVKVSSQLNFNIDSLLIDYNQQKLDSNKVITNNKIINYYMYRNPELAKKYAFEQLAMSNNIKFSGGQSMANYQLGILYNNNNKVDSARYRYTQALKFAKTYNNYIFVSQAYHGLALLEFELGNLDKADEINDMNLAYNTKNKDSVGIAYSLDFKGRINENRGHYTIALENVLKSLRILPVVSTPINKDVRIADAKTHLAAIELNIGNFKKSIDYNKEALEIYVNQNDTYYQAVALTDLGKAYKALGEFEDAEHNFKLSIEKAKEANVPSTQATALGELGSLYFLQNKSSESLKLLRESIKIAERIGSERRVAISKLEMVDVLNSKNQSKKAFNHISEVISYASNSGNLSILKDCYLKRSTANSNLGNPLGALLDYKEYKTLNDSIFNKERIQKLEEFRIIYETEKKEAEITLQNEEIKTLNEKSRADKLQKGLYAGGMTSALALFGLSVFGFRQRIKKNKIAREKQEEIYKQEIEHKKKELTSQTLHLVQKNTFIQELMENLENVKNSPDKFKTEFRRIVMLLKKENASDQDWEVFKTYFADVHNDFDQKLKTLSTDISEKEIRLAAFLRMNLTTKEIAATLNVLPDSILKSKYRLKKKLGLDKEIDLSSFLNTL
ncbi:tetratricopeptide repeat protein [uncultured Croceitalea sp.]|uniref:tetratricopeptide repeat protein n=1 Tax=uncultured Croceitalea sp. TaxID=1798908 RepID=UPI0033060A98